MEKVPLKDRYNTAVQFELSSLAILQKPNIGDEQYLNNILSLSSQNEIFAMYYLLNEPTLYVVKSCFSKSARCKLIYNVYSTENGNKIGTIFYPALMALLSDNQYLMRTFARHLKGLQSNRFDDVYNPLVFAIFALLEDKLDEFDILLNNLSVAVHKTKPKLKKYGGFVRALDGIRQGAAASVVEGVLQLMDTRHQREENLSYLHDAFGLVPHGFLKLAWLKGMQVQVDHPLIRPELLPVAPLESYPFYENLRFEV